MEHDFTALVLTADGHIKLEPKDLHSFVLSELRTLADCDTIDIVPTNCEYGYDLLLCVDDCGALLGKPVNWLATRLYGMAIYGDAVVGCRERSPLDEPDIYALPTPEARRIANRLAFESL